MIGFGLPLLLVLFVWWFSTGLILFLDGLPRRTYAFSMIGASLLLGVAFAAASLAAADPSPRGAIIAFCAAIMVWGWNEMAFLMGYLSGPRRQDCPPDAKGFRRFRLAVLTLIDHELALVASGLVLLWVTWGGANQMALATFLVLWAMRLSTKLNIFLGAPNLPVAFLPPHLGYLASYFRRAPMNAFFPLSITAATLVTGWLAHAAWTAPAGSFTGMSHAVLAVLMALAVLEHWLLMLPIPSTFLWGWGLRSRRLGAAAPVEPTLLRQFEPLPNPARVTKSGLGRPA